VCGNVACQDEDDDGYAFWVCCPCDVVLGSREALEVQEDAGDQDGGEK